MKKNTFKEYVSCDTKRNKGRSGYVRRLLWLLRRSHFSHGFIRRFFSILLYLHSKKHGIEIKPETMIGKGLYIGHPYNITINSKVTIGDNCNIHKGVTIGIENRGARKGAPTLGNCVYVGINSTIVGKIIIGDDVLIAPNTFVNCDVPSHSIVIGNPCIVKTKDKCCTEFYINDKA